MLLTTHYIEEARQAHRVGLMRAGKMLLQGTPRGIMNQTHSRTLEQAFLKICKKDEKVSDKDEHDKSNEDEDDDEEEEDGELDSPSSEDEAGGDGEAEAAALNQGSAGAGAGSNDSSSRGPNRSPLSSPSGRASARSGSGSYASHEDTDKDDSALREKRPSSKESGGKATFAGITNQDYHEPLLTRTPTPTPTSTSTGWAKANKGGTGSTRHLQSPDPDNGVDEELDDDDDDDEQDGKGTSKNRDGDRAPPLEGCAKITAALALPRWPQLWALSWKNLMRMAKGVAALIFQFVLPR